MASKLEYLKKYMSGEDLKDGDEKRKKKKKKSKVKDAGGLKIIDENDFPIASNSKSKEKTKKAIKSEPLDDEDEAEALALMTTQEELPQVAGVVDDSRLKTRFTTGGWSNAFEAKEIKKEPRSDDDNDDEPRLTKRRRRDSSDEDELPRRRKRHDSDDDDISPPRRKRHDSSSDNSPPRRQRRKSDSDNSPPRRTRNQSGEDSDISPPRIKQEDSDISPPRIKQEPEEDNDMSPPRKKVGLQDAKTLKEEITKFKEKEKKMFAEMSAEVSGKGAKTKVRGRLKDKEEEERIKEERAELVRKDMEARYARWNKGLKQLEAQKAQIANDLHEMDKPLARSKDDEDLDAHLKAKERLEDPMLQYMRKKQKKATAGLPQYPTYKGPPPPPNRFGIPPGYRWDGVDRSTGFEKKLFESQNKRKAILEEAHMWSTEDM